MASVHRVSNCHGRSALASMASLPLRNRLLLGNLHALRHLPAGTILRDPFDSAERELLADVLALPEGVDALRWARAERGPLIARATLRRALLSLRATLSASEILRGQGRSVGRRHVALLGHLLDLPE